MEEESAYLKFAVMAEEKQPSSSQDKNNSDHIEDKLDLKHSESKQKKIGTKVFLAIFIVLMLALGGTGAFFGIRAVRLISSTNAEKQARERENTLALANRYIDSGLYDKALDLLNALLIKNADDAEAQELLAKAAALMKQTEGFQGGASGQQGSLDINVSTGTNTINEAMQSTIDTLRTELARQSEESKRNAQAMQDQLARQTEESKRNAQVMQDELARQTEESKRNAQALQDQLARQTEESKRNAQAMQDELARQTEENRRNVEAMNELMRIQKEQAEAQRAAEAERKALQEAEAKQRAIQEEKRKAEEAKKAAESAAAAKLIDDINSEIAKGKAALNSGDIEGAMAHFNRAKQLLPADDPSFAADKMSEISNAIYDASQNLAADDPKRKKLMEEALAYAETAVSKDADSPASHYILAMKEFDTKDYAKAEAELRKAIAADPTNAMYYYQLGRAQAQQKKYEAAATSFQSSVKYNANYAPAEYNLGYVSERLGKQSQALAAYRKAYQIDSNYERAYLAAGRILSRTGDTKGAIQAFGEAIRINPSNPQNYEEQGQVYSAAGKYVEAEASFRKALNYMNPQKKDPLTFYNLSTVMTMQGKNTEALAYAKQAYDNKDSAPKQIKTSIIYNYALLCDDAGDTETAITLYKEVLAADSQNVKARTNLGVLCIEQGDADSAISLLKGAYEKDPKNFEVCTNLGNAYRLKEDYDSAVQYYQAALELKPQDNTALENLAKAYASSAQYDKAKTVYEDIVLAHPDNWDARFELAKVYMQLKENENAKAQLLFLTEKNPSYKSEEVKQLLQSL